MTQLRQLSLMNVKPFAIQSLLNMLCLLPLCAVRFTVPSCCGVPVQLVDATQVVWILHLYSGRRRIGDCHWWLEQHRPQDLAWDAVLYAITGYSC